MYIHQIILIIKYVLLHAQIDALQIVIVGLYFFAEENTITCAVAPFTSGSLIGTLYLREQVTYSVVYMTHALVNFKPHPWASPHPRWGFDINTVTTPRTVDIEVEFFVAKAWNHTRYCLKLQQLNT